MQALFTPLYELAEYEQIKKELHKCQGIIQVAGCVDTQKWHMTHGLSDDYRYKIIATFSELNMRDIYEQYRAYDRNTYIYPAKDLIFYQADIHGNQQTKERIRVLKRLMQKKPITIITTFDALLAPQIPLSVYEKNIITLKKNEEVDLRALSEQLVALGYEKTHQVMNPGQFAVRGDILDVFDLTEDNPVRVELWGDEIESIRSFDVESQRSIEPLNSVQIFPARETILSKSRKEKGMAAIEKEAEHQYELFRKEFKTEEAHRIKQQITELKDDLFTFQNMTNLDSYLHYFYEETSGLLDFLEPDKSLLVLDEPVRIKEHVDAVELEFRDSMSNRLEKGYLLPRQTELLLESAKLVTTFAKRSVLALSMMDAKCSLFPVKARFEVEVKMVSPYNHSFETLVKDLSKYRKNKYRMILLSPSRTRARRLAEDLRENEIAAVFSEDPFREAIPGEVLCMVGNVTRGFEYPLLHFVVIAESDIFGVHKEKKKKKSAFAGTKIQDFAELHVGDYVVHEMYGLGQYQGIEKIEVDHVMKDYIKLQYAGNGSVYVPATGLHILQKYASQDAKAPKLSKLGSKEWAKTKQKVRTAVETVAKDLVQLYAYRQHEEGYQYGPDTVWQKEFEEMFAYEETEDQMAAIEATKKDMESRKIMDRLICGDVGYGKTEVAIRAAFKAVQEGKQVVYLVPTTILAQQHYHTFTQRMKDYPVRVDLMCRFRTPSQQKTTITDLKKGFVDIVIGTHRVLSKDMEFKDLGLLIIDEEQRFGVSDKEKIKKLKENIDVLTLTATPIPRTLHMSLIGVRDMSLLEEAPQDRVPIQTYVMEYNPEMVREAIVRELSRGGQVFYVYNRVNDIEQVCADVQALVPEATVSFAHGQMKEHELERIMYDFVNGEIDVLVSTTIIETGMDISNANTMIIHDADSLGLSQLYQLRGRVGRSNRTAYAFMMYKRGKLLKEVAEKRLQAIKEFTDLGSGFKIAMRDLEIRGAGNLLGKAQHGYMESVGYDMYCKMLGEAVTIAQGGKVRADFDTKVDISADAYIPGEYILNEVQKLDIYKRIAGVETNAEKDDMLAELEDRFGSVPTSVINLIRINMIRTRAHRMYITDVRNVRDRVQFVLRNDANVNPEQIPAFIKGYKGSMTFTPVGAPTFTYRMALTGMVEKDAQLLLETCEGILEAMEQEIYVQ